MDDVYTKLTHEMGQFVQLIFWRKFMQIIPAVPLFFYRIIKFVALAIMHYAAYKIDESLLSLDPIIIV